MTIINMQIMRYINLLDRVTHVKTRRCFIYNNTIFFAVPKIMISRALGPSASNLRILQEQLGKRVRIIPEAESPEEAERFVENIVSPVRFKSLMIKDGIFVLSATIASKASLIGRNKRRLDELSQIMKDNFGADLKIV